MGRTARHGASRGGAAAVVGAAGLIVFFAEILWLIPGFGGGGAFRHLGSNYSFGSSPSEALRLALGRA